MSKRRKSREGVDEENESLLSENWKCLVCLEDDDNPIIKCDDCTKWYHMSCVGVSGGENIPHWACTACEVSIKKQKAASISPTVSQPQTMLQVKPKEIQIVSQRYQTPTAKTRSVISKESSVISKSSTTVSKIKQVQLLECEELYNAQVEYIKNKYKLLLEDEVDIPGEVDESVIVTKERRLTQGPIDKAINLQQRSHKGYEQCRNREIPTSISKVQATQGESKVNQNITNQTQNWVKNIRHQDSQIMGKNQITRIAEQTADHIMSRNAVPRRLPFFNGDVKDWPVFYHAFQTSTEELKLSDSQNLVRLREALKGEALELVGEELIFPESIPIVMRTLKQVYGRPDVIIHAALERLRVLPSPDITDMLSIIKYSSAVRSLIIKIEASDSNDHINNPVMFHEVLQKMSPALQLEWTRYRRRHNEESNLAALKDFLSYLADDAAELAVVSGCKAADKKVRAKPNNSSGPNYRGQPTILVHTNDVINAQRPAVTNENENQNRCILCDDSYHEVDKCKRFNELSIKKRWDAIEEKKLCRTCLKAHQGWKCPTPKKCGTDGCERWHHKLLHKKRDMSNIDGQQSHSSPSKLTNLAHRVRKEIYFRIVPVTLHNEGKSIETYAFLDDGSSGTLLDDDIADELGLEGPTSDLHIKWTANNSRIEENSKYINISISGWDKQKYKMCGVRTVKEQNLPSQTLVKEQISVRYPYLKNVPFMNYVDVKPKILIGLDQSYLIATHKLIEGDYNQPSAALTKLGWVVTFVW